MDWLGRAQRHYIYRSNEMSKNLPAKGEANKLHGATSNDTDAQGSHEQAEVGDRFDALLEQLSTVIGIDDVLFCKGLLNQIFWMFQDKDGKFDGAQFGFVIASLQHDKPLNRTEAKRKAQGLATHLLAMEFAKRLWFAKTPQEVDIAERTYNKLARTWLAQHQALEPNRSGSTPNETVVSVSDGSQAIVGDVTQNTHELTPDKPAPPTPEKGAPSMALPAGAKETVIPPSNEGTVQTQTGVHRRKESDGR
jgi:hypothetical protein